MQKMKYVPYKYSNCPIPGGGFVTGILYHPEFENILYIRTDIGGVYRYNFETKTWKSLMDHVTTMGKWETYPLSLALDPHNPSWLYIIAGQADNNYLCRSKDYGQSFEYFELPCRVHGNAPGRGTGERLVVDPNNSQIIYLGSQENGLFVSEDYGESWSSLEVKAKDMQPESDIAFIFVDPNSQKEGKSQTLVISTSGKENSPANNRRGPSLYISKDAGQSFEVMPGQIPLEDYGNYPGFVGQRAYQSGEYLFVTMAANAYSWAGWHGYACDQGGDQIGLILRYKLNENGEITEVKNVTPKTSKDQTDIADSGFGGICAAKDKENIIITSSQNSVRGSVIYYSNDYGENWKIILKGLEIGQMDFTGAPYMQPQYNGNANLIHWLSDLKINPFNSNQAVFNTGTGVFMTENLLAAEKAEDVVWEVRSKGIEETVHLNVYSPSAGDVKLIDIVGDLGGFAFTDLDKPCENSFADDEGNRYITCMNADFSDAKPELILATARGNWTGETKGGLILTEDQCKSWTLLDYPLGISTKIDQLIARIKEPNNNSGWVAVSVDTKTIVWSIADFNYLPMDAVVYSDDYGQSWQKVKFFDLNGQAIKHPEKHTFKVFSDWKNPNYFYGFGDNSSFYLSDDKGRSFYKVKKAANFPNLELGGIDDLLIAEIRLEREKSGIIWIATGAAGLWKLSADFEHKQLEFERVSQLEDQIFRVGLGKAHPDSAHKTLYVNGLIDGVYGFYRSFDEGKSWQRINSDEQMYGDIRSIAGDPREFGRFYLATGSRGVLTGQEDE